jgi:hypothetical protein
MYKMIERSRRSPRGAETDLVAGNLNPQTVHPPVVQGFLVYEVELDLPLLHGGRPDDQLLG